MKENPLKYLVIHCTATPEGREVSAEDIRAWHLMPRDEFDGSGKYLHTVYKGGIYKKRSLLPDEKINGIHIKNGHGRGWRQVGYTELIHLNGKREVLVPHDNDGMVDGWEITNGATGINSISRHIVYAGGMNKVNTKPADTRTKAQIAAMLAICLETILECPDVKIAGHNQFAAKACPSFDVRKWATEIGFNPKNVN